MSDGEMRCAAVLAQVKSKAWTLGGGSRANGVEPAPNQAAVEALPGEGGERIGAWQRGRDRREHFGELVQMDGSFHEWLEKRGPRGCLMSLVDDATSITLCGMGEQETIWAAVGVLRAWMEKYGVPVPRALYTDWKNVYVREPTAKAGTGTGADRRRAVFRGVRLGSALNARLRLAGLRSGRSHGKP